MRPQHRVLHAGRAALHEGRVPEGLVPRAEQQRVLAVPVDADPGPEAQGRGGVQRVWHAARGPAREPRALVDVGQVEGRGGVGAAALGQPGVACHEEALGDVEVELGRAGGRGRLQGLAGRLLAALVAPEHGGERLGHGRLGVLDELAVVVDLVEAALGAHDAVVVDVRGAGDEVLELEGVGELGRAGRQEVRLLGAAVHVVEVAGQLGREPVDLALGAVVGEAGLGVGAVGVVATMTAGPLDVAAGRGDAVEEAAAAGVAEVVPAAGPELVAGVDAELAAQPEAARVALAGRADPGAAEEGRQGHDLVQQGRAVLRAAGYGAADRAVVDLETKRAGG